MHFKLLFCGSCEVCCCHILVFCSLFFVCIGFACWLCAISSTTGAFLTNKCASLRFFCRFCYSSFVLSYFAGFWGLMLPYSGFLFFALCLHRFFVLVVCDLLDYWSFFDVSLSLVCGFRRHFETMLAGHKSDDPNTLDCNSRSSSLFNKVLDMADRISTYFWAFSVNLLIVVVLAWSAVCETCSELSRRSTALFWLFWRITRTRSKLTAMTMALLPVGISGRGAWLNLLSCMIHLVFRDPEDKDKDSEKKVEAKKADKK